MITVYTTNSCSSCKKAIKWLNDHQIKFTEKIYLQNQLLGKILK